MSKNRQELDFLAEEENRAYSRILFSLKKKEKKHLGQVKHCLRAKEIMAIGDAVLSYISNNHPYETAGLMIEKNSFMKYSILGKHIEGSTEGFPLRLAEVSFDYMDQPLPIVSIQSLDLMQDRKLKDLSEQLRVYFRYE